MKLLLTSNGLSNELIAHALEELVGKKPADTKIAFIPTASHAERENKDWLINDLYRLSSRDYIVDLVELTALTPEVIGEILRESDVIFVGGGNTFYLSYWMQKAGLFDILPELLETKVYAGISAGSMITGQSLVLTSEALNAPNVFADDGYDLLGPVGASAGETLKLVDFNFRPHLNSVGFPLARVDFLAEKAKQVPTPIYALDDDSALTVVDGTVRVISEGEWALFNADGVVER